MFGRCWEKTLIPNELYYPQKWDLQGVLKMKKLLLALGVFLLSVESLLSQLSVGIKTDQQIYLSGEAIYLTMEVCNLSGQTLVLGEYPDWLEITLETQDSKTISRTANLDLSGEFKLTSSMSAKRAINIQPYFDLLGSGRYKVTATVHLPQWEQTFTSATQFFEVIKGVELVAFNVGVPEEKKEGPVEDAEEEEVKQDAPTNNSSLKPGPETRRYALVKVSYLDKMRLYVRITDIYGAIIYHVIPVCGMVAFSSPKALVDSESQLHILNQVHAKRFIYFVVNSKGEMVRRFFYDYIGTKPVLNQNDDGSINVRNGVRIRTSFDFPPTPVPVQPPSIVTMPGDSITNAPPAHEEEMTKEEKKRYKEEKKRIKAEEKRLKKEAKRREKAKDNW